MLAVESEAKASSVKAFLFLAPPTLAKDITRRAEKALLSLRNCAVKAKMNCGPKAAVNPSGETATPGGRLTVAGYQCSRQQLEKKVTKVGEVRPHSPSVWDRYVVDTEACLAGKRTTVELALISREAFHELAGC
ncbi:MAG: hypothetical protein D6721_06500 [Gammaproteobacteria bacterium]|nr:MAG: hypothetical protein D6721_06500 [Gammaproteobacteria bacterium]